jgi:hypothetical protein
MKVSLILLRLRSSLKRNHACPALSGDSSSLALYLSNQATVTSEFHVKFKFFLNII